jgi:hypothetical protein
MGTINKYKKIFNKLLEATMGNVKPLISEQDNGRGVNPGKQETKKQSIECDVETEGIKNVTAAMISAPFTDFKGMYSGHVISGTFNGVEYVWDFGNIVNGIRGMSWGYIQTGNASDLIDLADDIDPVGQAIGFTDEDQGYYFICYKSKSGGYKVLYNY